MRAAVVNEPGGDFELVEREIPKPGTGEPPRGSRNL